MGEEGERVGRANSVNLVRPNTLGLVRRRLQGETLQSAPVSGNNEPGVYHKLSVSAVYIKA